MREASQPMWCPAYLTRFPPVSSSTQVCSQSSGKVTDITGSRDTPKSEIIPYTEQSKYIDILQCRPCRAAGARLPFRSAAHKRQRKAHFYVRLSNAGCKRDGTFGEMGVRYHIEGMCRLPRKVFATRKHCNTIRAFAGADGIDDGGHLHPLHNFIQITT